MRHKYWKFGVILGACMVFVLAAFFYFRGTQQKPTLRVAATIFPMYDVVRFIGADAVDVELLLPGGESPDQLPAIYRRANWPSFQRVFAVGHGFDTDALPADVQDLVFVPDRDVELLLEQESTGNPYYWLSVRQMQKVASAAAGELTRLDPQNARLFEKRRSLLVSQLGALDTNISALLNQLPRKIVFMYGYDWSYFLEDYGMTPVWSRSHTQPLTSEDRTELSEALDRYGGTVIFSDITIDPGQLLPLVISERIALENLDAQGGVAERTSYLSTMAYNARTIFENLQTASAQ